MGDTNLVLCEFKSVLLTVRFCVAVKVDLGSVLLVSHVESCHVHHLRFVLHSSVLVS